MTENIDVEDNPDNNRYEIRVGGTLAGIVEYETGDDIVALVHTEIFDAFEGQGLAPELVSSALDDIRARNLLVQPVCPYVNRYIRRHPEYGDLVAE